MMGLLLAPSSFQRTSGIFPSSLFVATQDADFPIPARPIIANVEIRDIPQHPSAFAQSATGQLPRFLATIVFRLAITAQYLVDRPLFPWSVMQLFVQYYSAITSITSSICYIIL